MINVFHITFVAITVFKNTLSLFAKKIKSKAIIASSWCDSYSLFISVMNLMTAFTYIPLKLAIH